MYCLFTVDNLSIFIVLKKCLTHLKLSHLRITTHSFRIGAATEAARIGLEEKAI